jgi:hypothetical protein
VDLNDSEYKSCYIVFNDISAKRAQLPITPDLNHGTCNSTLGDSCLSGIQNRIDAIFYASDDDPCTLISAAMGQIGAENPSCTAVQWGGLTKGTPTSMPRSRRSPSFGQPVMLTAWDRKAAGSSSNQKEDFSLYDTAVGVPIPFLLAITHTATDGEKFVVPILVCLPADIIEEGSRGPFGTRAPLNTPPPGGWPTATASSPTKTPSLGSRIGSAEMIT